MPHRHVPYSRRRVPAGAFARANPGRIAGPKPPGVAGASLVRQLPRQVSVERKAADVRFDA